jgi:hypothetical protein
MEDASKAKAAIAALSDFNLKGNRIRVEVRIYSKIGCVYFIFYCIRYQQLRIAIQVVHRK